MFKPIVGKQRILKKDPGKIPVDVIEKLPDGILYVGKNSDPFIENPEDQIRVGEFLINVHEVTKQDIKKMRTYFPSE